PLHDPFVDLRHLVAEELDQQAGMSPRQDDLRALGSELDVENEGADAIALPVALARDLFLLRQDRVGPAEVHDDVLLLEALHDAGDELAFAALELVVDDVALGVAHALDDVLLRRLGGDPAELLRRQLGEQLVADLGLGIELAPSLLDGDERTHDAADGRLMDRHALGIHRLERPVEHPAVTDRIMGANPYPLPERATEVRLAQQGPVDARRRTLELVATRDRVVRV